MSFFYDLIENVKISNIHNEMIVSIIIGQKILIVADFKIINLSENLIEIEYKKSLYKVLGDSLKVESLSKGEIVITGNVLGFVRG